MHNFIIFAPHEALEKRCRAEKQTRKRYELHQQIVKLGKGSWDMIVNLYFRNNLIYHSSSGKWPQ
jgi:hypothetical protein